MTQVTVLVTPSDVTASLVFPAITVGANRKALLMLSGTNGTTASMPTSLTIGGVTPTNEAGLALGASNPRSASGLFSLDETQIAAMSGSAIVYSGGNLAEPRLVALVIQDTAQIATVDKSFYSSAGASVASGATAAFDRIAESWTFFGFHNNSLSTATMSNPSTISAYSSANSRTTIGYAADTARNIASSFTVSASRIYAFSVNFRPVPSQTITTTNGGSPVKVGSTFSSVVTGFTGIVSGTIGGKALSSLNYSANTITATAASYVDGGVFYEPDTNQSLIYVNGVETASLLIPTASPDGMTSVVIVNPETIDNTYLTEAIAGIANPDRIVFPTEGGDFSIAADGKITCATAGARVLWWWDASSGVMTQLNVTINEVGAIVSAGLTSSGLTSSGLTRVGLTSSGL